MKAITKQQAKAFDKKTFADIKQQEYMDELIEIINDFIKINYHALEQGHPIFYKMGVTDSFELLGELKRQYRENGFELNFNNFLLSIKII